MYEELKATVPEGMSGNWRVEHFTVNEKEARWNNMLTAFTPGGGARGVPPGEYTRLMHGRTVVMSDTPAEVRDHYEPIRQAHGRCLINGLGLGIVVQGMLHKPEVEHLTVIEISPDVLALVADHYQAIFSDRLEIIEADALTWQAPKGAWYDIVWHDIWSNICTDNLETMGTLHRKYGRRCGWQGSWQREWLQYLRRRERDQERTWGRRA